jgi:hypothetical protein
VPIARSSRIAATLIFVAFALAVAPSPLRAQVSPDHKTQHVIFVMTDGLRWQEVFRGAEESLMN